jgi:hypothetical protein
MSEAFICDAVRTPVGRYAGALSTVRADDSVPPALSRRPHSVKSVEQPCHGPGRPDRSKILNLPEQPDKG